MVLQYFRRKADTDELSDALGLTAEGTDWYDIVPELRRRGFRVRDSPSMSLASLRRALATRAVVIVSLDGDHTGVVWGMSSTHVHLADPSFLRSFFSEVTHETFLARWDNEGITVRR